MTRLSAHPDDKVAKTNIQAPPLPIPEANGSAVPSPTMQSLSFGSTLNHNPGHQSERSSRKPQPTSAKATFHCKAIFKRTKDGIAKHLFSPRTTHNLILACLIMATLLVMMRCSLIDCMKHAEMQQQHATMVEDKLLVLQSHVKMLAERSAQGFKTSKV